MEFMEKSSEETALSKGRTVSPEMIHIPSIIEIDVPSTNVNYVYLLITNLA